MHNKYFNNACSHAQNAIKHTGSALYSAGKLGLVTAAAVIPGFQSLSGRVMTERTGAHMLKAVAPCTTSSSPIFCTANIALDSAAYCLYNNPVTSLGAYIGTYWYFFHYDLVKDVAVSTVHAARETFYAAKECAIGLYEMLTFSEEIEETYAKMGLVRDSMQSLEDDTTISTKANSEITEDDINILGERDLVGDFY